MRTWVFVLAAATVCLGRVDRWPEYLTIPSGESPEDSTALEFSTRQTALENTFESHDRVVVRRRDSMQTVEQVAGYELVNDRVLETMDQHLDLSGQYMRRGRRWKNTSIGFEWSPSFLLNTRDSGNGFLGTIDMGPKFGVSALGVPIELHGGVTGRRWSEALPREMSAGWLDMMSSDFGVYAGVGIGDGGARVGALPVYVGGSGYARATDSTSRLSVGSGQVLLGHRVSTGDSVFAYFADTLAWGHERLFEGRSYVEVPERRAHSFRLAAGVKGTRERMIAPAVVYSFAQYSEAYPDWNILRDRRNRKHTLALLAWADSVLTLSYSGGLKVRWEYEDRLHRHDLGREPGPNEGDSLYWATLRDFEETTIGMTHEVSRKWTSGLGIRYLFDIYREKVVYPFYFLVHDPTGRTHGDTMRSDDDRYWITQQHTAQLALPTFLHVRTVLSGGYSRNSSLYTKSTRSEDNNETHTYSLGLDIDFRPLEGFVLSEALKAEARVTEYSFPEFQRHPFDPPSYTRTFSSLTKARWQVTPTFSVEGELEEVYWDDGYWNGSEYYEPDTLLDTNTAIRTDYYAIGRKSLDSWFTLSGRFVLWDYFALTAGSKLGNVYYREWDSLEKAYVENTLGIGPLYLEPFVAVQSNSENGLLAGGQIKRIMHDPLRKLCLPEDYWEINLICRLFF